MNELKEITKDKVVNERQVKEEKQNKLIGQVRPRKGHTLFEYNVETNEIKKAVVESVIDIHEGKRNSVQVNRNCLYISALNEKNAIKKLMKKYGK